MSLTSSAIVPNPWVRVLDALEKKINRHSYDTWLKPTRYSHAANGILFVRIPTAEFRHVGDKYADLIQEALDNLDLGYQDVKFVTAEDDPSNTPIRHNGGLSAPSSHSPLQRAQITDVVMARISRLELDEELECGLIRLRFQALDHFFPMIPEQILASATRFVG